MANAARMLRAMSKGPSKGEQYTASRRGADKSRWAGNIIIAEIGKTEAQAKAIIKDWIDSKVVIQADYHSPATRKNISGLTVDEARISEMERQIEPTENTAPLA